MIYALISIAIGWHYHRRATDTGRNCWIAWSAAAAGSGAGLVADLAIRLCAELIAGPGAAASNPIPMVIGTTIAAYLCGLPIQLVISERLIPEPP